MIDNQVKGEVTPARTSLRGRAFGRIARAPRIVRYALASAFAMLAMVGSQVSAFAATDDGSDGVTSLFDGAKSNVGTVLIPAVVAIVLLGSLFWLGLTWFHKGKNKGNK